MYPAPPVTNTFIARDGTDRQYDGASTVRRSTFVAAALLGVSGES
jgi:hypothetical protein